MLPGPQQQPLACPRHHGTVHGGASRALLGHWAGLGCSGLDLPAAGLTSSSLIRKVSLEQNSELTACSSVSMLNKVLKP